MTAEHVWPLWLSEAWVPIRGKRPYEADMRTSGRRKSSKNISYKPKVMDTKVKPVCEPCNNVTLSDLEGRAKNAILNMSVGQAIELKKPELQNVALWITRIAMLWDFAQPHEHGPYFSQEDRKSFIQMLKPPNDSWVWLAPFIPDTMRAAIIVIQQGNEKTREGMIVATGVIGCFAFQFLSRRWDERPSNGQIYGMMYPIIKDWQSLAVPLWPDPPTLLRWPPTTYGLALDRFNSFADRWGGRSQKLT